MHIGLTQFLVVSALLFSAGVATAVLKRNAIGMLMGVELILNAGNVNLAAFNYYSDGARMAGQVFAVFVIILAAAEAAVALAIFLNFYNNFASIDVEKGASLKA